MKTFWRGFLAGAVVACVLVGGIFGVMVFNNRDKGILEYAEKQKAIETLREDYGNRDPYEFIDAVPGVRGSADGAIADFERRRNEAVQRFRNRLAD